MLSIAQHATPGGPPPVLAAIVDCLAPNIPEDPSAEPFLFLAEFDDPEAGTIWKIQRANGSIEYVSVVELLAPSLCTL